VVVGRWCGEVDMARVTRTLDGETAAEADDPEQVLVETEEGGPLQPQPLSHRPA
jgi:hypothetical protein